MLKEVTLFGFLILALVIIGVWCSLSTSIPQHTKEVVYRTVTVPAETSRVYIPVDRFVNGLDRYETSYVSMPSETVFVSVLPKPVAECDSAVMNNIAWADSFATINANVLTCGRLLDIAMSYTLRERNIQLAETLYIPRNKPKWIPYITAGSSPLLGAGVMRDRWMLGYVYTPNNQWQHGVHVSFLLRKP